MPTPPSLHDVPEVRLRIFFQLDIDMNMAKSRLALIFSSFCLEIQSQIVATQVFPPSVRSISQLPKLTLR